MHCSHITLLWQGSKFCACCSAQHTYCTNCGCWCPTTQDVKQTICHAAATTTPCCGCCTQPHYHICNLSCCRHNHTPLWLLHCPLADAPGASSSRNGAAAGAAAPRKASKLEELMQRDLADKQRRAAAAVAAPAQGAGAGASGGSAGTVGASGSGRRDASWLMPGIIVKVVSKALKEAGYYKSKVCV